MYPIKCPVCEHDTIEDVYTREGTPYSIFWQNNAALPQIDMVVSLCKGCMFLFQKSAYLIREYDAVMAEVYNAYRIMDGSIKPFPLPESSLSYSVRFLIDNLNFSKIAHVLEIGSNRGDFLYHLKSKFRHINIIGIEPSNLDFVGVPTVKAFFSNDIFSSKFDLIILRHVLEHVKYPKDFIVDIKNVLNADGNVFIEVPNTKNDLIEKVEVFTPDHVSYFTAPAMRRLISEAGMRLQAITDGATSPLLLLAKGQYKKNQHETLMSQRDIKNNENYPSPTPLPQGEGMRGEGVFLDEQNSISEDDNREVVSQYKEAIDNTVRSVKNFIDKQYKIVFYGSRNAFLWFYSVFDKKIANGNLRKYVLTVLDDSTERIGRKVLEFPINSFDYVNGIKDRRVMFILCSNREGAGIMVHRIKNAGFKDYKVILPWVGELA